MIEAELFSGRTITWMSVVFLHDDSTNEDVVDDVINVLREELSVAIFDVTAANFSIKSVPPWALGRMFMLMGTQETISKLFTQVRKIPG